MKIRSPTRVRRSCLTSISNPLRKVGTVTFDATNANTTLLQSEFIDPPLEFFSFSSRRIFCIFLNLFESAWRARGTLGEQGWRIASTSVARVRILASMPYVGWGCCWSTPLLREVFLRVLRFPPLLKNQYLQIPIRSGTHGHISASS